MLQVIREAWNWAGFQNPRAILAQNEFGNLLFVDAQDSVWRICPEDLACKKVAASQIEYVQLWRDDEFLRDWQMIPLVKIAQTKYGIQPEGWCFCLKIPAVLGGAYDIDNIGTITLRELIDAPGDLGRQIKDLPDGTKVKLRIE